MWHAEMTDDLRLHLAKRVASAIFPPTKEDLEKSKDERIKKLFNFSKKVY